MSKILITGASGMVGKNLLPLLKKNKKNYLTPSSKELNLMNKTAVKNYLKKNKINTVIHLAAKVGGIQANINNNLDFFLSNTIINLNLISESYKLKIPRFLNIASTCMYPANISKKIKEDMLFTGKLETTNEGYALSKINALKLCEYINRQEPRFSYKTIIPCNMFGYYDKFDVGTGHLVPAIINKIIEAKINNKKNVTIWGSGNARREFMYAEDFAKIIIKILDNFDEIPEIMNIGTGKDYKIKDYYNIVRELVGWKGSWKYDRKKPEGMKRKLADTYYQKKLNLMPKTSLKNGIKKTIKFYLNNLDEK